jgi:ParB family chromosome partitioning protein
MTDDRHTPKGRLVLGRGLESLIPRPPAPVREAPPPAAGQDDGVTNEIIASVDLDQIQTNPYQPRADFDAVALDELKRSILEKGVIQPVTVRRTAGGYQLISGERRVRAAREAGLTRIPAYIIRVDSDREMLELALIENLQREHLNPIEIAISYRRLLEECDLTQEQVSERIGKDRSTVTNFLRLLRLPEPIQASVRRGEVTTGHARALVGIEDSDLQMRIFRKTVAKGLSVREVERLVRDAGKRSTATPGPAAPRTGAPLDSALASVEERLRQALGTKVTLRPSHDGRGEIVLEYYSADDLERLIELIANR